MMPYRSEKQSAFMHAKHPGIAARWDRESKSKAVKRKTTVARQKRGK